MVDMTPIAEGTFVDVAMISKSQSKIVIPTGEGQITENEFKGEITQQLVIPVEIDGKPKKLRINKDSANQLIDFYGDADTKALVGKKIRASVENKNGRPTAVFKPMKDDSPSTQVEKIPTAEELAKK